MRTVDLHAGEIESFLATSDLFGSLDSSVLRPLAEAFEPVLVTAGEVVVAQGDPAEGLYMVHTGRLGISRTLEGQVEYLAEVGAGETVGELALVTDRPRSATAVASRDSRLLHLPLKAFESLVATHPAALRALTTQVVDHLERPRPTGTRLGVIAIVPMHASALVDRAVDELVDALRGGADRIGVLRETAGFEETHFRVHRLEQMYDLLVAVASAEEGAWSASCVHQADRVVLVGDATTDADSTPVERQVTARDATLPVRKELVLAHPAATVMPSGTKAWLAGRNLARHHHLRVGDRGHAQRVARLLTDRGIGLVCSGGGARSLAEVGVIQAMDELGIPIDAVTGTSAGSIVGGTCALGWSTDRMKRLLRRHFVEEGRPVEFTMPMVSLSSGARMTHRLREVCGDLEMEDTWLDFGCISTNLSTRERMVHRSGPAWRAVRASISIPGVFPPVSYEGDLLVDGGVVDNLPIGALVERHPGIKPVAVDVGVHRDLTAGDLPEHTVVRGWEILRDRLDPRRRPLQMAGIAAVMARLAELGSSDSDDFDQAQIMIRPDVHDVALLDFAAFDDLVRRGHADGLDALEPWWADVR